MVIIKLFSDGGAYSRYNLAISSGIIFVNDKKVMTFCKTSYNRNSDFAELFAINKVLSRAYGYCKQKNMFNGDFIINLYTDSLTSILSIQNKNYDSNNEKRIQLINEIKDTMKKFDNRVVFYHIKSHISLSNLKKAYFMFCKENGVNISFSEFQFLHQQNKKCDRMISQKFIKVIKEKYLNKTI